jgi:hypothetical protein
MEAVGKKQSRLVHRQEGFPASGCGNCLRGLDCWRSLSLAALEATIGQPSTAVESFRDSQVGWVRVAAKTIST